MKIKDRKRFKNRLEALIYYAVLLSFLAPLVLCVFRLATMRGDVNSAGRSAADYSFILLESVIGLVLMFLPQLIARRWRVAIPSAYLLAYVLFLYCAIFLGEIRSYYYRFSNWDTILHCFSGMALGAMGFYVVNFLNENEKVPITLSASFVMLFSFCFALACGALWEIFEFTVDGFFGKNMQKFRLENGIPLLGREALADTMEDLIVDSIGAIVFIVVGRLDMRHRKKKAEKEKND